MSRVPAVANMFYPGEKGQLEEQLSSFVKPVAGPRKVLAAISPHAGYKYSGGVAGAVEVLGVHYKFYAAFSPGYGWDAIAVALLGLLHPIGVVASAFLFGVLRSGSITMQAIAQISKDIVLVLTALIIFFTATNKTLQPILERAVTRFSSRRGGSEA